MIQDLEEKLKKYIQACGCELYSLEITREANQDILRVNLYSKEGVTLEQCQQVSNLISPFLDVEDPISSKYILEVGSPGVERILKDPRHFHFSIGEEIRVKMVDNTFLSGVIQSSNQEGFVLKDHQGQERFIPYAETKKVKTIFQW